MGGGGGGRVDYKGFWQWVDLVLEMKMLFRWLVF